ncbi:hypothetical protein RCL_jg22786.t1 [Rhizophagus clarus]|uniref:Uncharacterized protein n=1 Tax=Rhizophagus clarus TaxID=94130 RepID=A0A8H3LEY6_9GLOM|nr:hypothetical protein RCL_jg22786.t1 [Rhizophagus clarus]
MEVQPLDSLEYLDAQDFNDMWNFKANTSDLNVVQDQFGYMNTKLDKKTSLVQDETVDEPTLMSSTSGHLDMGIGEDNQYFRIFMDLECGFSGHSLDLRMLWFLGIGNGFVFWLNGENKSSLDL